MNGFGEKVAFIWSVADLLRGYYKQADYGKVILPLTVLRRMDCALASTKEKVLAENERVKALGVKDPDSILKGIAGYQFYNTSPWTFQKLREHGAASAAENLKGFINGFSKDAFDVMGNFKFYEQIDYLDSKDLLFLVLSRFAEIDLHPDKVSNVEMGYIFEELIRKFSEMSNETAGEHFTPREVIRCMVNLLLSEDSEGLSTPSAIRTVFDPACGTGGMLSVATDWVQRFNPKAIIKVFGQELNPESFAICKSDMMIKGEDPSNVRLGNSFSEDRFQGMTFDYMLSNPPFGVEWKNVEKNVRKEFEDKGFDGRFGAGLPRISDGSMLFLQHMISKMKPEGSRIAIVFNGSPMFTGDAGSGESEIRKWIIENDWLEAVVALPDQLFYNTGISTYFWIVTNRKTEHRQGKIQLIDARGLFQKMRKSLGNKRNELSDDHIAEITRIYGEFREGPCCKIFDNEDFGYLKITVERPLRRKMRKADEILENLREYFAADSILSGKLLPVLRFAVEKDIETATMRVAQKSNLETTLAGLLFQIVAGWKPLSYEEFLKVLKNHFKQAGVKWSKRYETELAALVYERAEDGEIVCDSKGRPVPDSELRDTENVPLKEDPYEYFKREVLPWAQDAWIDEDKGKVGYEINFNRYFYKYTPPRLLDEIEVDLKKIEMEIAGLLSGMTE